MRLLITIIFFFVFMNVFAQNQKAEAKYSLCGKPCSETISLNKEEFKKCDKELLALTSGDRIFSFEIVIQKGGNFSNFQSEGKNFPVQACLAIENVRSGQKVLIENVKMVHENKVINIPGVVIIIN